MFSTGGDNGGYETPLFYIFDLVTLSWTNSYDPGGEPYTLPAEIYSIIGGRFEGSNFRGPASSTADCCMIYSSSGNATNKEPGGGWSSPKVRDIFNLTPAPPTSLPNGSTPAPPTSSPNGSTPVGKIIGAIVGGMLVILTLCFLYGYRQRSKAHKGLHPLPKCFRIRNIPQNWNEDDLQNTLKLFACDQCPTRQLSLYPSCYDSTKTALLNLNACSKHLELPGYLLVRGSVDGTTPIYLVIDSNFHNLTPLNDPKSEIVAEYVFPALSKSLHMLISGLLQCDCGDRPCRACV